MAFVLQGSGVGCFQGSEENLFTFLFTNFTEFYKETVTIDEIEERSSDENSSIRVSLTKTLKLLKEQVPTCSGMKKTSDEMLRIDLSYPVSVAHNFKFYFITKKCNSDEIGKLFVSGLIKQVIENSLLLERLRKACEAKDQEIEEYKRNGATLVRQTLETKKINYSEEKQNCAVSFVDNHVSMDLSSLLNEQANIPALTKLIHAESIEKPKATRKTEQNVKKGSSSRGNLRAQMAPSRAKQFEYVDDSQEDSFEVENDDMEDVPETSNVPETSKSQVTKAGGAKKSRINAKKFEL